tara:strand:+ start:121 stop:660 length:540 start_codon:yes stop_codon:yes gene_type:complete
MAFDSSIGGVASNSYSSISNADEYFVTRLSSSVWTSADEPTKQSALVTATSQLDRLQFIGEPATQTQALSWPRDFVPVPDPSGIYWGQELRLREHYEPSNAIPKRILEALYEVCFLLLTDNTLTEDPSLRQFEELEVPGVVKLVINNNALPRLFNKNVRTLIDPYMKARNFAVPVLRAN